MFQIIDIVSTEMSEKAKEKIIIVFKKMKIEREKN
jgi:hypothetical protein